MSSQPTVWVITTIRAFVNTLLSNCKQREGVGCVIENLKTNILKLIYDSLSDVGEIRVYQRADFQSGSRVLKKVF